MSNLDPRIRGVLLRVAAGVLGCLAVGACASPGGPPLSEIAPEVNRTLELRGVPIAIGDTLALDFTYRADWNRELLVAEDGNVSLPGLGATQVAGRVPVELERQLELRYGELLDDAELSLSVAARLATTVTVMGEVGSPGELTLRPDGRLSLVEAIGQAGSYRKESAYLANLLLVRWDASVGQQRAWKIDARPRHWNGEEPLLLQPYDVVFIPNTPIDRVGIWVDNYIRRLLPLPFFSIAPN